MMVLRVIAVLVFAVLGGLAVSTLLISRGDTAFPTQVSGSPTPTEFLPRKVENVLGLGDFVTRAPDGEAYVLIQYGSPQAFKSLVHTYEWEVWPQYRVNSAQLHTSDDGTNWAYAAEASEREEKLVFDVDKAGAHKFWRMTVVSSGAAAEVVVGRLAFVRHGFFQNLPVDLLWLGLVPASLLLLVSFKIPLTVGRVFLATAVPVTLFLSLYSLGYVNFDTLVSDDSGNYLAPVQYGQYSLTRSPGYPIFLIAAHKIAGLEYLPWIQFGIGIACYMAGAWLLAVRFANKWMASLLALAILFQGALTEWAPQVLTEALFMAGFGLFAAALGTLAWQPRKSATLAAAFGIMLATIAKSIGIVLVVPALLLIRFLPQGKRLSVSGAIIGCGLATYGAMAIHTFIREGIPRPESFAGFALIGHVGGMLDDASMPPSDLTRSMIGKAAAVVAQRPADLDNINSLATLDRYVRYTSSDYNTILWLNLVPTAAAEIKSYAALDSYLLRFALSSIHAHPFLYLRHVSAHFYGMWRDLGRTKSLRVASIDIRQPRISPYRTTLPSSLLGPYRGEFALREDAAREASLPLMLSVWNVQQHYSQWGFRLGVLALLLCILYLLPGRLAFAYRTEIMIALSLNAYFGAHVLLQVTLHRYAALGIFAAIFLAVSFVFTTFNLLSSGIAEYRRGRARQLDSRGSVA